MPFDKIQECGLMEEVYDVLSAFSSFVCVTDGENCFHVVDVFVVSCCFVRNKNDGSSHA